MTIKNKLCILSIGLVSVAPKLSAMKPEMPKFEAMNKLRRINYSENVSKTNAVFEFLLSQEDAFISENKYPEILPFPTEDNTIINKALALYFSHVSDLVAAKILSSYRAASFMHDVLNNFSNILMGDLSRALSDFELYISTIDSIYAAINQSQDIRDQRIVLSNGLKRLEDDHKFLKQSNKSEYKYSITSLTARIINLETNVYCYDLSPKEQLECIKFGFPKDSMQYTLMNDDVDNLIDIMNQPSRSIHENIDMRGFNFLIDGNHVSKISLIDLAALNGSVKCFKYLSLNKAVVTNKTFNMAIIGGNIEIVQLLKHNGIGVESIGLINSIDALKLSMRYCRYDIANWIYASMDMSTGTLSSDVYSNWLMNANNNTILTKLMDLRNQSTIPFEKIMNSRSSSDMLGFIIEHSISFPNIVIGYDNYCNICIEPLIISQHEDFETINIHKANHVIDWAFRNNRIDIFDVLIAKGADINFKHNHDYTHLDLVAISGTKELAEYLLKNGADINTRTKNGGTPLHFAVQSRNLSIVKYLVEKGADVNARDKYDKTPLHIALDRSNLSIVKYLVEKGADVNAKDKYGDMPLHFAARHNYLAAVEYLVEKGAYVNASDKYGNTPLLFAVRCYDLSIVKYLVEKGAYVNCRDKDGNTPLWYSQEKGHNYKITSYLIAHGATV